MRNCNMRPRVFLCHSKADQNFITQLAADLRPARVEVWYDDWEIPPGASLRSKIFESGIPGCDLFFVYLTQSSVESEWVKQELDAAFIIEFERKGSFMALFVDSDETRERLSADLRSRRIPPINTENYSERLLELTALSWEAFTKKSVTETRELNRIALLELKKIIVEQKLEIANLQSKDLVNYSRILKELDETNVKVSGKEATLKELFLYLSNTLAVGDIDGVIYREIRRFFGLKPDDEYAAGEGSTVIDILGQLIILGLVKVQPPIPRGYTDKDMFYITEVGRNTVLESRK